MKLLRQSLPIIVILGLLQVAYRIFEYKIFPERVSNFVWWAYLLFQFIVFLLLVQSERSFKRLYLLAYVILLGVAGCNLIFFYLLHQHIDTQHKHQVAEQVARLVKERAELRAKEKGVKISVSESSFKEDYEKTLQKFEIKGLMIDFLFAGIFNLFFASIWALIAWLFFNNLGSNLAK